MDKLRTANRVLENHVEKLRGSLSAARSDAAEQAALLAGKSRSESRASSLDPESSDVSGLNAQLQAVNLEMAASNRQLHQQVGCLILSELQQLFAVHLGLGRG